MKHKKHSDGQVEEITTRSWVSREIFISSNKSDTYICCLFVIVNMVDITSKAKISNFHDIILGYENIPSSQISVDALKGGKNTLMLIMSKMVQLTAPVRSLSYCVPTGGRPTHQNTLVRALSHCAGFCGTS